MFSSDFINRLKCCGKVLGTHFLSINFQQRAQVDNYTLFTNLDYNQSDRKFADMISLHMMYNA